EIKTVLADPALYEPSASKSQLEQLANAERSITLYNPSGLVVYSSNPASSTFGLNKELLFEDLYKLEQGFHTYSLKEPVFNDRELVGIFHVELARDEWVSGVTDRSLWLVAAFIVFFIFIYLLIVRLVNRKLNRPLTELMNEMTAFASGLTVAESATK